MEAYIKMEILPYEIPSDAWEEFYTDSIEILKETICLRMEEMNILGGSRRVLIPDCETKKGKESYWSVNSSLDTIFIGSTFSLYEDIEHYRRKLKCCHNNRSRVFSGTVLNIVGHHYVLAVALLAFNMFQSKVFIKGYVLEDTVKKAVELLEKHFNQDFKLPKELMRKRGKAFEDWKGLVNRIEYRNALFKMADAAKNVIIPEIKDILVVFDDECEKQLKIEFLRAYIGISMNEIMTLEAWKRIEGEKSLCKLYLLAGAACNMADDMRIKTLKKAILEYTEVYEEFSNIFFGKD